MNSVRRPLVCVARSPRAEYGPASAEAAPELPGGRVDTVASVTLRNLFLEWGLDRENAGTPRWNPLGQWISPGSRVTIKPNWVLHFNQAKQGMDCLVTHTSVLEAVLEYVALARPSIVTIGDAPLQSCDFDALRRICAIDEMAERYSMRGFALRIADFRRTILHEVFSNREEDARPPGDFVLFDLGRESLLAPLDADAQRFRVTMYDPERLRRTHGPGVHQYLVAREIIEADTIINVPKLKAHKKAGVTGALKNLVGINGNKEYLPHHRKGGAADGGDCYPGRSRWKRTAEDLLDAANRRAPGGVQRALFRASERLAAIAGDMNLEGSWYGNDTVWRMCLDLQRVVAYGASDGKLHSTRQRNVLHITDSIIGGEGEGPLAPWPVPSAFLSASDNCAAAEWVHCRLMGYDPRKIPVVREAFGRFTYPIAEFRPEEIRVLVNGEDTPLDRLFPFEGRAFRLPAGWTGHCELEQSQENDPITQPPVVA